MMYFLTQNIHNKDGKSDIDGGAIVQKNIHGVSTLYCESKLGSNAVVNQLSLTPSQC